MRIIPFLLIAVCLFGCANSKTNTLWTKVYPDYIAVSVFEAPAELKELKEKNVMNGDNWYWSPDGKWIFVKRPLADRCFGYSGKVLGTPIAMTWDGIIIVGKTLDGSISKDQGNFMMGLAQLAQIIGAFNGHK
jgi:hypothetical protein